MCVFLLVIPQICWDALATRVHAAVLPEDCQLSSPLLPPLLISQCMPVSASAASNSMGEMKSLFSLASKWEEWLVGLRQGWNME